MLNDMPIKHTLNEVPPLYKILYKPKGKIKPFDRSIIKEIHFQTEEYFNYWLNGSFDLAEEKYNVEIYKKEKTHYTLIRVDK